MKQKEQPSVHCEIVEVHDDIEDKAPINCTITLLLGPFSSSLSPSELLLAPLPALLPSLLPSAGTPLHGPGRPTARI